MTAEPEAEDPNPVEPVDLWAAADRLTQRHRRRLWHDDGTSEQVTLPSLWEQLAEAARQGTEGHSRGVPGSRPPTDVAVVALRSEIMHTIRNTCALHDLVWRVYDVPASLRAVVAAVNRTRDQDAMRDVVDQLRNWAGRIRATIANDPDRTWRMHGAACRTCASTTVPVWSDDGTEHRQPALLVHSADGVIDRIECGFCGTVLTGPDLVAIVRDARRHAGGLPTVGEAAS